MKKIVAIVTVILVMVMMTSCSNQPTAPSASTSPSIGGVIKLSQDSDVVSIYLSEYKKRIEADNSSSFLSEEEQNLIQDMGYQLKDSQARVVYCSSLYDKSQNDKLYYPILFENSDGKVELWGIDEHGCLSAGSKYSSYLHTGGTKLNAEVLMQSPFSAIYYDESTGLVQKWAYGDLIHQCQIPAGSIYAGYSSWEGYIFRSGSNVFSTFNNEDDDTSVLIAHNVQQVLLTDYSYSSDSWSQPLFLMEDGSLKAYVGWNGNQNIPDDTSHLMNIEEDGGYVKTYYPFVS